MTHQTIELQVGKAYTDEEIKAWFLASPWSIDLPFTLHESSDRRQFAAQYLSNEAAWKATFDFMKNNDLSQLPVGRYELTADGATFANVSEYEAKEYEAAPYEAHRKYIDLQYVAEGEEGIELLPLSHITEEQDYNDAKDVVFFKTPEKGAIHPANKQVYFLFFPDDVHKPGLRINAGSHIKKIIVKIPFSS